MKTLMKAIATVCAAALLLAPICALASGAQETSYSPKGPSQDPAREEAVYATLSASGALLDVYTVNLVHPDGSRLVEYGAFEDVMNLTDTTPIAEADGCIVIDSGAEGLYYQATLAGAALPWTVGIEYAVDGRPVPAASIGGVSGALDVRIRTAPAPGAHGEYAAFCENYMLQATVTLDAVKCSGIDPGAAQVASSGTDRVLTFVAMPDSEGDFAFSADVRDFELAPIRIAAVPFSMPVSEDSMGGMDELDDAAGELMDASKELRDGLAKAARELGKQDLSAGADSLGISEGMGMLGELDKLDGLSALPKSLREISAAVTGSASGISALSASLTQLSAGYDAAFAALDGMASALPSGGKLDPQSPEYDPAVAAAIGALAAANPGDIGLSELQGAYQSAAALRGAYFGAGAGGQGGQGGAPVTGAQGLRDAFSGAGAALPAAAGGTAAAADGLSQIAAGLSRMAAELESSLSTFSKDAIKAKTDAQIADAEAKLTAKFSGLKDDLQKLKDGLAELSDGYGEFHDGLSEYTDGVSELTDAFRQKDFTPPSYSSKKNGDAAAVQFILMTEPIEAPAKGAGGSGDGKSGAAGDGGSGEEAAGKGPFAAFIEKLKGIFGISDG